jgi:tetratricopeptide (TPR) repeat protein
MRNKLLVLAISVCLLAVLPHLFPMQDQNVRGGVVTVTVRSFLSSAAAAFPGAGGGPGDEAFGEAGYNDLPTSGGKPVFATKADLIISSAESFIKSEQYDEALKLAREVTDKYPDYVNGWMILAYCESLKENYMASNLAYEKVLSMGADPKVVYERTAYNYLKLQNWDAARASYLQILELDGKDVEILLQLGHLEAKTNNKEKALSYYRKVLSLEPDNITAMSSMAKLLDNLGSSAEARAVLEEATSVDPDNTKFLWKLSLMHMKDRDYKDALEVLQKLVVLDSTNAKVHQNLGITLYQLDRKSMAAEEFEKGAHLGGSLDGLYGPLAECLQSSGQPAKALTYIKEGLTDGKQQAWLYSIWGKILEDEQNYDGAIAKFSQAVALGEEPWSGYARKQIVRQQKLKQRKEMLAKEASEM